MSFVGRCVALSLWMVAAGGVARAQTPPASMVVLHSFNGSDGATPNAPLLPVGNDFYGTTEGGGQFGWGSIFRISRTGTFTLLYSFLGLGDGARPQRLVLGPDRAVYGTTTEVQRSGQPPIHGTFFRIAPSGALVTLYVFSRVTDGYAPGRLTLAKDGLFYGIAMGGGTLPKPIPIPSGTAFRLNANGELTMLHVFSAADPIYTFRGQNRLGPLVQGDDGTFYASDGGIIKMTLRGDVSFVTSVGNAALPDLMSGRDGRIYGSAVNGFPCDHGSVFSFSPAGDFRGGRPIDRCGDYTTYFQTADLTLVGVYSADVTTVIRMTPQFVIPSPAAFPTFSSFLWLTDGADGQMYGVTRGGSSASDFGSVIVLSILGTPKAPTNVRITPG